MIKVFEAQHIPEAHLVCSLLQSEGISAEIKGENLSSIIGTGIDVPGVLPTVWISDPAKSEQARTLVSKFLKGDSFSTSAPTWECAQCNEIHESQFASCWKCGASKPNPLQA